MTTQPSRLVHDLADLESGTETRSVVVLGGGGVGGTAWMLGLLSGACNLGFDLAAADSLVATSAGPSSPLPPC